MKELDHVGLDAYRATRGCWALGAGAIAGAVLFGAIPSAMADDPALNPPDCTAADWRASHRVCQRPHPHTSSPTPT